MSVYHYLKRFITLFAALSFFGMQLAAPVAQAAMVGTDALLQSQQAQSERADLMALFEREDVRKQMIEMGVDSEAAKQRVTSLTDAEVSSLNDQLTDLPAGGNILGIILVVFIVFVVTDVIGATDIFPFIHPVN